MLRVRCISCAAADPPRNKRGALCLYAVQSCQRVEQPGPVFCVRWISLVWSNGPIGFEQQVLVPLDNPSSVYPIARQPPILRTGSSLELLSMTGIRTL